MSEPVRYELSRQQGDALQEATDGFAPADVFDPVIEAYKKDVDRTILRENLKLSPQERSEKFVSRMKMALPPEGLQSTEEEEFPAEAAHPTIEAIKAGVDRSLLRKNLGLTQEERAERFLSFASFAGQLRAAGVEARAKNPDWGLK